MSDQNSIVEPSKEAIAELIKKSGGGLSPTTARAHLIKKAQLALQGESPPEADEQPKKKRKGKTQEAAEPTPSPEPEPPSTAAQ